MDQKLNSEIESKLWTIKARIKSTLGVLFDELNELVEVINYAKTN